MTLRELLVGPLVGGGASIVWVLLVHRKIGGDRFASLGVRTDRVWLEVVCGVLLAGLLLVLHLGLSRPLNELFPPQPPPEEIVELLSGLSRRPALLALWLGPVVWIGIAGFEELWRVHLLRRLWHVWPGPGG